MSAGALKHRARRHALMASALRGRVHGLTAASFDADLHPRGKDGKWIEKFGLINVSGLPGFKHDDVQGRVLRIDPDRKDPGNPIIRVAMTDPRWKSDQMVNVRRDQITSREKPKGSIQVGDVLNQPDELERRGLPSGREESISDSMEGDRATLEAQIPTGVSDSDAAMLDNLRRRVHDWEAAEAASRFADAEVTVISPTGDSQRRADEDLLAKLRERVHRLEEKLRDRTPAMA